MNVTPYSESKVPLKLNRYILHGENPSRITVGHIINIYWRKRHQRCWTDSLGFFQTASMPKYYSKYNSNKQYSMEKQITRDIESILSQFHVIQENITLFDNGVHNETIHI